MANKCLFANLLLFGSEEGDEATSPSFTTNYTSIQASSPSLETLISAWCVQWDANCEHVNHGKQMPVCQSFSFLRAERATRQRHPLLQQVTRLIQASSASHGNAHFSLVRSVGMQTASTFTHGKQMPVCQSFSFCERRGRRGNVALFYNKLRIDPSFQRIAWKRSFQLGAFSGDANREHFTPRPTNASLPKYLLFKLAERAKRRAFPSFTTS